MAGPPRVRGVRVRSPWYLGALVVGSFVVYATTLRSYFMGDDFESTQAVLDPGPSLRWLTEQGAGGHMRPVLWVVVWLNHAVFGLEPTGWHAVNLLLHALTAWLVAVLTEQLLARSASGRECSETVARWAPTLAGVVFLVSPVHAEPVSWIAARADLLLAPLCIVSLLGWIRWRDDGGRWLWLSVGAFVLALGAKQTAMSFPLVLVAYELWFPRPDLGRAASLRRSLGALAAVAAVLVAYLVHYAIVFSGFFGGEGELVATQGPLTLIRGAIETLARSVLPSMPRSAWAGVGIVLLVGLVVVALPWRRARRRGEHLPHVALVGFCATAAVICVAPAARLGASLETPGGGRFAYLPSVFAAVVVAVLLAELVAHAPRVGTAVAAVVVLASIASLVASNQVYVRGGRVSERIIESQAQWPRDEPILVLAAPDTFDGAWVGRNRSPYDLLLVHDWTDPGRYLEVSAFEMGGERDTITASAGSCDWCVHLELDDPDARFTLPQIDEVPSDPDAPFPHVTQIDDRSVDIELAPGTDLGTVWYFSGGGFVPLDLPLG